jgi:hypothetical protein
MQARHEKSVVTVALSLRARLTMTGVALPVRPTIAPFWIVPPLRDRLGVEVAMNFEKAAMARAWQS